MKKLFVILFVALSFSCVSSKSTSVASPYIGKHKIKKTYFYERIYNKFKKTPPSLRRSYNKDLCFEYVTNLMQEKI